MKLSMMFLISLCLTCLMSYSASAAPIASAEEVPLATGKNVLAAIAVNDAPGSSDLTLIIQLIADGEIVLDEDHECTYIMPLENIPSDNDPIGWTDPMFDDSDWEVGPYGIGYGDGDDNTVVGDGAHATVYSRAIFEIQNAASVNEFEIGVDYDDAFVIFINGVEVARESGTDIPEIPEWDSWSDRGSGHSHEASKVDPPRYSFITLPVETTSIFAVDSADKLAATWSRIKSSY
jgi:hypothetical protein